MNRTVARTLAFLLLLALIASFAACKTGSDPAEVSNYTYKPGETTAASSTEAPAALGFTVDPSWQADFAVEYRYFNRENAEETVTIRETRAPDAFAAVYPATGNFLYYKTGEKGVDLYTVVPSEKQYVHTVLKDKKLADLSSTYMKLTAVAADLPELANVLYMADETVAGRVCKKYIQRAYTDGAVTETVYVWVDTVYGFALKCEDYNASNELQTSWETVSFSFGGVTEADFGIDLSQYTFTEGK